MLALGIIEIMIALVFLAFGLGGTVFWVWMLIDCASKESNDGNDKLVWVLIIIFTHWIGALIYLLVRRPKRVEELGK